VADDVYEMLQWAMDGSQPKPLRWHAQQQGAGASVVSLGSWSKILGPGLRLGWVDAEGAVLQQLAADGEVDSGSFSSPLVESLVATMIERGAVREHLQRLRAALSRRAALLAAAINGELPEGLPPVVASAPAGYFLWVDLRGADANELRERCIASHGVSFLPGTRCALEADAAPSYARVCFAFLEEEQLAEAGRRLGRAIAAGHSGSSSGD
jgi:DNA-binding transcriptional MocR family regulator